MFQMKASIILTDEVVFQTSFEKIGEIDIPKSDSRIFLLIILEFCSGM